MNTPTIITLTGIDESCAIGDLLSLMRVDPRIELAMLYSDTRMGSGRYPNSAWIGETAGLIREELGQRRLALHVCGRAVRRLLQGDMLDMHFAMIWDFQRLQLNGRLDELDVGALRRLLREHMFQFQRVITQYDQNPLLHGLVQRSPDGEPTEWRPVQQILFDASGGRGIERSEWPAHLGHWDCGYAGGLGPGNLARHLPRIAAAAGRFPYWIDMETKLRDGQDRFSIDLARRAIDAVLEWETTQHD